MKYLVYFEESSRLTYCSTSTNLVISAAVQILLVTFLKAVSVTNLEYVEFIDLFLEWSLNKLHPIAIWKAQE